MQCRITAHFGSVDEADRAAARLRSAIPNLSVKRRGGKGKALPGQAPLSASIYYPWRINMTVNEEGNMATELGSRALFTSDLMGLPIYRDGDTELLASLDAGDLGRARAILVNQGGKGVRILT